MFLGKYPREVVVNIAANFGLVFPDTAEFADFAGEVERLKALMAEAATVEKTVESVQEQPEQQNQPEQHEEQSQMSSTGVETTTEASITTTTGGVTISPSTITSEQRIAVTVPTDTNVYYDRITEDGNIRVSETFSNRITEGGDNKVIELEIEYTFEDGTIDKYYSYIIQEQ
jgi:hypothetical protein